jgi:hypothetical protein
MLLSSDLWTVNALMDRRMAEARQDAELFKLRQQAGQAEKGWLHQQRCRLLCQAGQLLTALGQRLEQVGLPESFPIES